MGLGGIGVWQILIVLVIVILLFGTSKLKNIGSDLGSALKGFKNSMNDNDADKESTKSKDADFDTLDKPQDEVVTSAKESEKQTTKD